MYLYSKYKASALWGIKANALTKTIHLIISHTFAAYSSATLMKIYGTYNCMTLASNFQLRQTEMNHRILYNRATPSHQYTYIVFRYIVQYKKLEVFSFLCDSAYVIKVKSPAYSDLCELSYHKFLFIRP